MNISTNVLDLNGKIIEQIQLDKDVFACDYRSDSMKHRMRPVQEVLRWQMNKKRMSTQKVKNRSEVSGAHRKVWAQKETGRARQGDGKACHFRGGGAAFAINSRDYSFKLNKRYVSLAKKIALSHKFQNGGVFVFEDLASYDLSKTKSAKSFLENIQDDRVLFVTTKDLYKSEALLGTKNLKYVDVIPAEGFNIRSIWDRALIFDKKSIMELQSRFNK